MEYEINKHYPLSERGAICLWWQSHRQYDINEYEDYVEIVPRDKKVFLSEQIRELKIFLSNTDYMAIKFAEGELSDLEFAEMKEKRKQARQKINEMEIEISLL